MKIHEDRRQALQVSRYPRQEKLALAASLALWCQSKQQAFNQKWSMNRTGGQREDVCRCRYGIIYLRRYLTQFLMNFSQSLWEMRSAVSSSASLSGQAVSARTFFSTCLEPASSRQLPDSVSDVIQYTTTFLEVSSFLFGEGRFFLIP